MKKALIFVLAFSALACSKTIEKEFKHQFKNIDSSSRLLLKHGDGDVTIETWDKDIIDVEVFYRISSTGFTRLSDDFYVEFEQRNDDCTIIGHEPSVNVFIGGLRIVYNYTIKTPPYVCLKTLGSDGDMEISDHQADMNIRLTDGDLYITDCQTEQIDITTTDGDIRIRDISAQLSIQSTDGEVDIDDLLSDDCRIRLTDGDIKISNARGNFKLQSTDGDIDMHRIELFKLFAKSSDGDISIDIEKTEKTDVDIESGDGNIILQVPDSLDAEIKAYTDDGDIEATLEDVLEKELHEHYFHGTLGNGHGRIKIRSGDGDIRLHQR